MHKPAVYNGDMAEEKYRLGTALVVQEYFTGSQLYLYYEACSSQIKTRCYVNPTAELVSNMVCATHEDLDNNYVFSGVSGGPIYEIRTDYMLNSYGTFSTRLTDIQTLMWRLTIRSQDKH